MYNPYEDKNDNQNTEINKTEETKIPEAPTSTASTASTASTTSYSAPVTPSAPETAETAKGESAPYTAPTYTAPTTTGASSYYTTGASYSPQPNNTYSSQPNSAYSQGSYYSSYSQPQPQQPQPSRSSYTWNGTQAPAQSYYQGAAAPEKKKKKKGGKTFLKVVAAVVACAVVSVSSVGVFALMIQNGVVNIQSSGNDNKTAAFTINKVVNDEQTASNVTTIQGQMSAQDVAEKLIPSVVCIQNYQISQGNSYFYYGGGQSENGSDVSPAGQGSGIIFSADGYIVTNQHVIANATSLKVITSDGQTYEATLVGEDSATDLAVIKIDAENLTPAEFGTSEDLRVADQVIAIGNPGGIQFNSSVTIGNVSALNRDVTNSDTGYTLSCIQTDAAINPGNSGGALVDLYGHVVGINSSKIVATGYEGLGFAIPAETAQPIISDLMEYGYVKDRAMLGITGSFVDSMSARFFGLESGYYVDQVNSENAKASGLQSGDVITAIDDTQVTSSTTITAYLSTKKPGDTVTLTVSRALAGQELTIELTLSEYTREVTTGQPN